MLTSSKCLCQQWFCLSKFRRASYKHVKEQFKVGMKLRFGITSEESAHFVKRKEWKTEFLLLAALIDLPWKAIET